MQQKTAPYDAVFVSAANWAFHLEDGIVKWGKRIGIQEIVRPACLLYTKQ